MSYKTFLFTALVCVLSWCCVSCESNDPTKNGGGSATYVAKEFSVSANKQVVFSPGNLQYQASTDTWRFANHQYDYLGELNKEISPINENWIDLFGWGTGNNPTNISEDCASYANFVDWGTNKIGNDMANMWRTLTVEEWQYLHSSRPNSSSLMGIARINLNETGTEYVNGLILLPDTWTCPDGIIFKSGFTNEWDEQAYADYQTYSLEQWSKLERAGAIFLPASGIRGAEEVVVEVMQKCGYYWSSSSRDSEYSYLYAFCSTEADLVEGVYWGACAVRLVKDF